MSIYNLRPYIGNIPMLGGYNLGPYILDPLWKQFGALTHWDFTDGTRIQEGATAVDVAGWDNTASPGTFDLTQATAAAQPEHIPTTHIEFDGSDYLEGLPPQTGDFTYVIKYKLDVLAPSINILVGTTGSDNFQFYIHDDNIRYKDQVGGSTSTWPSGQTLRDGQIRTLAIVRDSLLVTCYLDGINIGTIATTATPFIADRLGRWVNADFDFYGNMYNALIYPTALNAVEIAALTASLN